MHISRTNLNSCYGPSVCLLLFLSTMSLLDIWFSSFVPQTFFSMACLGLPSTYFLHLLHSHSPHLIYISAHFCSTNTFIYFQPTAALPLRSHIIPNIAFIFLQKKYLKAVLNELRRPSVRSDRLPFLFQTSLCFVRSFWDNGHLCAERVPSKFGLFALRMSSRFRFPCRDTISCPVIIRV